MNKLQMYDADSFDGSQEPKVENVNDSTNFYQVVDTIPVDQLVHETIQLAEEDPNPVEVAQTNPYVEDSNLNFKEVEGSEANQGKEPE